MSNDLITRLPKVGELTLPMWQDWLVRYNDVLKEQERLTKHFERALRSIAEVPIGAEMPDRTTIWGLATYMQETAKDALKEKKESNGLGL